MTEVRVKSLSACFPISQNVRLALQFFCKYLYACYPISQNILFVLHITIGSIQMSSNGFFSSNFLKSFEISGKLSQAIILCFLFNLFFESTLTGNLQQKREKSFSHPPKVRILSPRSRSPHRTPSLTDQLFPSKMQFKSETIIYYHFLNSLL